MENFTQEYFKEAIQIIEQLDTNKIESVVQKLSDVRERGGRLFFLGVGGSAANCSHAVNDFRKICGFEAYAPVDNVSELTARTNDEGWDTVFSEWLKTSRINDKDALFIFSVGGGNAEKNVSLNLVRAIDLAKEVGADIFGVVGKDNGHTAKSSDFVVVIPQINSSHVTPHSEAFQGVVWHMMVTHPKLKKVQTKWESVK